MKVNEWVSSNRKNFLEGDLCFIIKSAFSGNYSPLIGDLPLDEEKRDYLEKIKRIYIKGVPLAYILGKEEFFGREFRITPQVLIPRKETEIIVEKTIEVVRKNGFKYILDIGCGCGNIAISVKKALGDRIVMVAGDKSFKALKVAFHNAMIHNTNINLINTSKPTHEP